MKFANDELQPTVKEKRTMLTNSNNSSKKIKTKHFVNAMHTFLEYAISLGMKRLSISRIRSSTAAVNKPAKMVVILNFFRISFVGMFAITFNKMCGTAWVETTLIWLFDITVAIIEYAAFATPYINESWWTRRNGGVADKCTAEKKDGAVARVCSVASYWILFLLLFSGPATFDKNKR